MELTTQAQEFEQSKGMRNLIAAIVGRAVIVPTPHGPIRLPIPDLIPRRVWRRI